MCARAQKGDLSSRAAPVFGDVDDVDMLAPRARVGVVAVYMLEAQVEGYPDVRERAVVGTGESDPPAARVALERRAEVGMRDVGAEAARQQRSSLALDERRDFGIDEAEIVELPERGTRAVLGPLVAREVAVGVLGEAFGPHRRVHRGDCRIVDLAARRDARVRIARRVVEVADAVLRPEFPVVPVVAFVVRDRRSWSSSFIAKSKRARVYRAVFPTATTRRFGEGIGRGPAAQRGVGTVEVWPEAVHGEMRRGE